ncbi:MAG: SIR2 family protein [Longimicrobiaceae bacterium]
MSTKQKQEKIQMNYNPRLDTEDYIEQNRWIQLVAEHLHHGSLALVLGAGASAGMGLPTWPELVRRCLDGAGVPYDPKQLEGNPTAERLGLLIDEVEDKYGAQHKYSPEYHALVSDALYRDVKLGTDICQAPLLIALGALLMGSRRGSIREVITFNFDIVLEYYLSLHGYTIQTFDRLPQLQSAADVRIAHINGVLHHAAYPVVTSRQLVFSARSMHKRTATPVEVWKQYFHDLLTTHLVLFVGLSGADPVVFPTLTLVDDTIREKRVTGIWMFGKDIDADPDSPYRKKDFLSRNIVPICKANYNEIPNDLLEVCRQAATTYS